MRQLTITIKGAPGSGKTTMAELLRQTLKGHKVGSVVVVDGGKEVKEVDRPNVLDQLERLGLDDTMVVIKTKDRARGGKKD